MLSYVNLFITTESRLVHAHPSTFFLGLNINGKVIWKGVERIDFQFEYKDIRLPALCGVILG